MSALGRRLGDWPLLVPGALVLVLSFRGGGFFPGTTAAAAVAVAALLAAHLLTAEAPGDGLHRGGIAVAAALAALAGWTILSGLWSDAPARALLDFDRVLIYLLVFAMFAAVGRTPRRLALFAAGLTVAATVVSLAALTTRLLPDLWPVAPSLTGRLGYPLTYPNALGLLTVVSALLLFHWSATRPARDPVTTLTAAALPLVLATLSLTFSRGAALAGTLAGIFYVIAVRPPMLREALISAVPASSVALLAVGQADRVVGREFATPAGVEQGARVALAMAIAVVIAAWLRRRPEAVARLGAVARARVRARRRAWIAVGLGAGVLLGAAVIADGLQRLSDGTRQATDDPRGRFAAGGDSGRGDWWQASLRAFGDSPIAGEGAGTFELRWQRERPDRRQVQDAHSLPVETLGELGAVGFALLAAVIAGMVAALWTRWRAGRDPLWGAVLAGAMAWTLAAAVDWHWEMPAVTVWLFAAGGLALATPPHSGRDISGPGRMTSVAVCMALAVVPALVLISESRLGRAEEAFARGDCREALENARSASSPLGVRPEPHLVTGYCEARAERAAGAQAAMREAVAKAPGEWEAHYGLAVAQAAAGTDPRPAARRAFELNPREAGRSADIVAMLQGETPLSWQEQAREARPVIRGISYPPAGG